MVYAVEFVPYKSAMYDALRRPRGMVGRHLSRRADLFLVAAKGQAGKGKTGKLARSIHVREHLAQTYGQLMKIGSTNRVAYLHHEGTRPHVIKPKSSDGVLVFPNRRGRVVVTRVVRHPGTRPNRYLTDNLKLFTMP